MHLLFDLDGTLADSFPGISRSINQTLTTLGREPVPEADLRQFVGGRLTAIFSTLLGSDDATLVDRAVDIYRPLFDEVGLFESCVFPGIREALTTFRNDGHVLQVVTIGAAQPDYVAHTVTDLVAWIQSRHVSKHQDASQLRAARD